MMALTVESTEVVLAVNVPAMAFAATVTEAGKLKTPAMAPETASDTPPAGAALFNVTVQVVLAFGAIEDAAHVRETGSTGATMERVADSEELPSDAVTVALWSVTN
jgi:hypothetical protein